MQNILRFPQNFSRTVRMITLSSLALGLAVCAQAQTLTTLAAFDGVDGYGPFSSVVQATDGNFYGTTNSGGNAYQAGTFFRVTPTGELTDLYNFCSQPKCADGTFLSSVPILGRDGNLYGVTGGGGNSTDSGTFYRMTLGGEITTLYAFCPNVGCADGQGPTGIVEGSDGNFYGTTSVVPNSNGGYGGTIFSISPSGKFKLLHTFCSRANCMDGDFSFYPPILGSDGNLYGVTYTGGNQGGGLLYELTSSGTYRVLYNFCPKSGTCENEGPFIIVRDSEGNFFGTTAYGGSSGYGAIFELTSTHRFAVLHNFASYNDWPYTGLTLANDGNLYAVSGGGNDNIILKITPAGVPTTVYRLPSSDGGPPVGPLFQGTDGSLYGTTTYGPGHFNGTVFKFSIGLSPLVETVPGAGEVGQHVLILGNGLNGTTSVTFNGVAAEFKVEKDTSIRATVPAGAITGTVSVVTPSGTLNSNPQFVVTK
jgi:uncharacterized repeat protein (TIGR03803 family)